MFIRRDQVLYWENLKDEGQVVTAITEFKRNGGQTQEQTQQQPQQQQPTETPTGNNNPAGGNNTAPTDQDETPITPTP